MHDFYVIKLDDERTASIKIPVPLTSDDKQRIIKFIELAWEQQQDFYIPDPWYEEEYQK